MTPGEKINELEQLIRRGKDQSHPDTYFFYIYGYQDGLIDYANSIFNESEEWQQGYADAQGDFENGVYD